MGHLVVYLAGALGAFSSFLIASTGDHITALLVACVAAAPGLLTYRETRRNRAAIHARRTVVTRGDTKVTITDEDLEQLSGESNTDQEG
jgi:hypothetical protein